MNKSNSAKCALAIASILLVLNAMTPSSLAVDYSKIGVKNGDSAEYAEVSDIESSNRVVVMFSNVTPPMVTITISSYNNETKIMNHTSTANISQLVPGCYLTAAGLSQGDPFYAGETRTINGTISMTVLGQTRDVNHMKYYGGTLDLFWDKETGLLVRAKTGLLIKTTHPTSHVWINLTLSSTSVFKSDMTLILVAGGILAVPVIAAAIIMLGRRKK